MTLKSFKMKCIDCNQLVGKYYATELPYMIAYFVCDNCMLEDDKEDNKKC